MSISKIVKKHLDAAVAEAGEQGHPPENVARYDLSPRGEIEVKGKGQMATCYLLGRTDEDIDDSRIAGNVI